MESSTHFGRFLAWTGAVTVLGAAACAALVVAVDPYRLYGLVERPGFNQVKPQPERYQKQIKLAGVRAIHGDVLIVGNSRAEIGLDPAYPALAAGGHTPYNLALAGTRIQVAREQLEQLHRMGQHPRHLIVGAEFLDAPLDPARPPAPAPATAAASPAAELAWRFDAVFSLDSLRDALKTMRLQDAPEAPMMSMQGFNPLREYGKMAREDGYHALFQQRALEYGKRLAKLPRALVGPDGSATSFEQLRAVIEHGAQDGARVDVVIYPYHAQLMALIDDAGMEPMLDEWRTRLTALVATARAAHPDVKITLWDFSGYAPYQCEAIPAKGDRRSVTRWYWEAGHFKGALGNLMLARILDQPDQDPAFGTVLDSASLAANRTRLTRERQQCLAANPALFKETAGLLAHH
ncbi:SGNH/GDSL hydrolase family protein [Massilia sp. CF038]|uniref:SGNH/GDSL hydrolase family protein n=1 Tax=Massilia sp. CF038 TaxID=1881045 RepID=UPI0009211404|nr:SGNH/GDSL hydrolase family protein [Massilia sp. CF038]SHH42045.1 hypothetical protein SAMN05428948_3944 [Massilia sp. CF038]